METTITINKIEEKTKKDGKQYTRVSTDKGWLSCFDAAASTALRASQGAPVRVEITESGEYRNISKVIGAEEFAGAKVSNVVLPVSSVAVKPVSAQTSMYVSYAKDIFLALVASEILPNDTSLKEMMNRSIELVKQARLSFDG